MGQLEAQSNTERILTGGLITACSEIPKEIGQLKAQNNTEGVLTGGLITAYCMIPQKRISWRLKTAPGGKEMEPSG